MTRTADRSSDNTVWVRRLRSEHGQEGFREFLPLSQEMVEEVGRAVGEIFDVFGGAGLLRSSGDVYIKPNVVGDNPYSFTRPEVVEAAVRYWLEAGARAVYVMESCTQGSCTRLVFHTTGYDALCERTGAVPVYLDEGGSVECEFAGRPSSEVDPDGYELTKVRLPQFVHERLVQDRDANLYVNIPKLKTHSMSVVTLGIKNQWGFPIHRHRGLDHNFNLHDKLVDLLGLVQPDVTLIEGVEGTIYGHYPAQALVDRCVRPFRVLIGGRNVFATDVVGARVFGKRIEDVPHLAIAAERGLGDGIEGPGDIRIEGDCEGYDDLDLLDEWEAHGGVYPDDLAPEFPEDVRIVYGTERACREGCVNNSLNTLQLMHLDGGGRGGWTLVLGKGFDDGVVVGIEGPVLLVGPCAVEEIGDRLIERLGSKRVHCSRECNDLAAVIESMCHLMKVSPFEMVPAVNPIKALTLVVQSWLNGSTARLTSPLANVIKLR